jgi:hypothetical protein
MRPTSVDVNRLDGVRDNTGSSAAPAVSSRSRLNRCSDIESPIQRIPHQRLQWYGITFNSAWFLSRNRERVKSAVWWAAA